MTPDPQIEDPPRVSYLSMVRPALSDVDSNLQFGQQLDSGFIAAAHERFVVLYAGPYRPANSSKGCYLVYDAAQKSGSLSTVPGIPYSASYNSVGDGTIIMVAPDGTFVLAELLTKLRSEPPQAVLCLWAQGTQSWEEKGGRLPAEVCPPKHVFTAHMAFCFNTSICCWVNLLKGLLLCDSLGDAKFYFVPFPDGYSIKNTSRSPGLHLRPDAFRSFSCVAGTIKFVSLDGYLHQPHTLVSITTWALDLHNDISLPAKWTKETSTLSMNVLLSLGRELWADDSSFFRDLTQIKPMYPVLSTQKNDLVYLVLARTEIVDGHREINVKLLSVYTRYSKVLSCVEYNNNRGCLWPEPFASEFSL